LKGADLMNRRKLEFLFQEPGLIEAIAFGSDERQVELITEGYRDCGIPDLMIDLHPDLLQPYCFMSMNFHRTYPAVIWGLHLMMDDEQFDVPQAGLIGVSLAEAFSWAYTHFILEDEKPQPIPTEKLTSLTRQVLHHALVEV
jgi:hypothetical protein